MLSTLHDPSPLWHQLAHGENDLLKDGVRLKDRKFCLKFARNTPHPSHPCSWCAVVCRQGANCEGGGSRLESPHLLSCLQTRVSWEEGGGRLESPGGQRSRSIPTPPVLTVRFQAVLTACLSSHQGDHHPGVNQCESCEKASKLILGSNKGSKKGRSSLSCPLRERCKQQAERERGEWHRLYLKIERKRVHLHYFLLTRKSQEAQHGHFPKAKAAASK